MGKMDRVGETNTNNQGLLMTIVGYRNASDIDVQFEDGTIVEHRQYVKFKIGKVKNPNYNDSLFKDRTGETNTNNQGLLMTIVKYRDSGDIDVQFEDGTIVEHKKYINFKKGSINNPNYKKRVGETNTNNQGLLMTIVGYRNYRDIDVQFEDGTILKHRAYNDFKIGKINNPNYNEYNKTGETNTNNQGLLMTIVGYRNANDIDVQFEDGTIVEHRTYGAFKKGSISYPFPYQLPNSDIILENVSYVYKDQVNYLYKCTKCGIQEIDTLENINIHKCK